MSVMTFKVESIDTLVALCPTDDTWIIRASPFHNSGGKYYTIKLVLTVFEPEDS